jgi:hypothetical protein
LQRIRCLDAPKERLWTLVVDSVVQQESSAVPCVLLELETSGLLIPERQLNQAFKLSKVFVRSLSCYFKIHGKASSTDFAESASFFLQK